MSENTVRGMELAEQKLRENGGLFVVEYAKCDALSVLVSLWKEAQGTFLCLVESGQIAREWQKLYPEVFRDFKIFDNVESFRTALAEKSCALNAVGAEKFSAAYPKIFVAREDAGAPVLHAPLGKFNKKSESYASCEGFRNYCVSDFLASCGYSNLAADDIYSFLHTDAESSYTEEKTLSPLEYDRVDFMERSYYFGERNSYKRLQAIFGSCETKIMLSDVLIKDATVYFYLAVKLLAGGFSYRTAKERVRAICEDYEETCSETRMDVADFFMDDDVIEELISKLRGSGQRIPTTVRGMRDYLTGALTYLSEEEILLRTVYPQMSSHGRRYQDVEDVLDEFRNSAHTAANALYELFFHDEIKRQTEREIRSYALCTYTKEELEFVLSLFREYGVTHRKKHALKVQTELFCRDDSAFGAIARSLVKTEGETEYSVCGDRTDGLYKAYAVAQKIRSKQMTAPVLVVTCDKDSTEEYFRQAGLSVTDNFSGKADVVVCDYLSLRSSAAFYTFRSVVYFEPCWDVNLFYNTIERLGGGTLMLSFDGLEAYFYLIWKEKFLDGWKSQGLAEGARLLPVDVGDYYMGRTLCHYEETTEKIDAAYRLFSAPDGTREAADETFRNAVKEYSDTATVTADDFQFLAALSKPIGGMYRNSFSTGGAGTAAVVFRSEPKGDGKHVSFVRKERELPASIFFNSCLKLLRGNCDTRIRDCYGCPDAAEYAVNDFDEYCRNSESFFALAEKERLSSLKRLEADIADAVIAGASAAQRLDALKKSVQTAAKNRTLAALRLEELKKKKPADRKEFRVPAEDVSALNELAKSVYAEVLNNYLGALNEALSKATDFVVKNLTLVNGNS